jgi:hypothetical protein
MIHYEVKLKLKHAHVALAGSVVFVLLFVSLTPFINFSSLSTSSMFGQNVEENQDGEIVEIDMIASGASQGGGQQQDVKMSDYDFYSPSPDIVLLKLLREKAVQKKNNIVNSFASFLSSLSGGSASESDSKSPNIVSGGQLAGSVGSGQGGTGVGAASGGGAAINYDRLLKRERKAVEEDENNVDSHKLRETLAAHQAQFQKCYESALLTDELLSGSATITVNVGNTASVQFKGVGEQKSIQMLQGCLQQKASSVRFKSDVPRGTKARFNIFFST